MAFFIGKVKWIVTYANVMMKIGGGMMIVTGILLYTNQMTKITAFFIRLFGGFTGFKMRRKKSEENNCYYISRGTRLGGVNFYNSKKEEKERKAKQAELQKKEVLPQVGFKAPSITLKGLDGKLQSLNDAKGKPYIINFGHHGVGRVKWRHLT